jgi:hypothetical protein
METETETLREAQGLIRAISGHGCIKERLRRAARALPFSPNRCKDIFYADRRVRLTDDELLALRRAAQAHAQRPAQGDLAVRVRELEALVVELSRALERNAC